MTDRKKGQKNIAIVLSAGRGSRMHSDVPKQYMELCGMPVIAWSLKAFQEFEPVDEIILVASEEDIDYCRYEIIEKYQYDKVSRIVPGGAERYLSVWEGLKAAGKILGTVPPEAGSAEKQEAVIFIHDGARPLIDQPILDRALRCAQEHGACVVGMPVKDTIKIADAEGFAAQTPDRSLLWQVQTPQVFSFPLVYEAYRKLTEEGVTAVTDDAMVVELETSVRVKLVKGSYRNLKITTPEDLSIAECLMNEN
ncbi:MAG: 2-C-methyl-D-erythritol 4-phosphate cytidylyltransferase [Lachnospiraceae bacterium]|nr:2-C-methyl-D-erythritol 4-phosphate cytidylyltransferase [Lachnospiraceae bacterium]